MSSETDRMLNSRSLSKNLLFFFFPLASVLVERRKKDEGENEGENNAAWMSGRVSEPIPSRACFPGSWTRPKEKEKRQRGRNGDESRCKNSLGRDGDEDEQEMPKEAEEQEEEEEEEEILHNRRKAHRATEEHTQGWCIYIYIYACVHGRRGE